MVQFLGPPGLSVVVEANELATREAHHARLVCHSRMVNRALDVTGLRNSSGSRHRAGSREQLTLTVRKSKRGGGW